MLICTNARFLRHFSIKKIYDDNIFLNDTHTYILHCISIFRKGQGEGTKRLQDGNDSHLLRMQRAVWPGVGELAFSTSSLPFVRSAIHVRWSGRSWIASFLVWIARQMFLLCYFQSSGHLIYLLYIFLLPFTPQILPCCGRKRNDEDEYQFHEFTLKLKFLI